MSRKAFTFGGNKGLDIVEGQIPADLVDQVEERRAELIEKVSEVSSRSGGVVVPVAFTSLLLSCCSSVVCRMYLRAPCMCLNVGTGCPQSVLCVVCHVTRAQHDAIVS